jgi:hypothetical protein
MKLPAAVLSTQAAPTLSDRYSFVNTREVVARMERAGFYVAAATSARPRSRDPMFSKHMIDFRIKGAERNQGTEPRIIFLNSHDGTTAARVMMGMFRFVCANGLVIGSAFDRSTQRHAGDAAAEIVRRMQDSARKATDMYATIDRWSKIECSQKDIDLYARMATQLRWGNANLFDAQEVVSARRPEDDRGDLWALFNRVQENTMRGGLLGTSMSGRRSTSRPLTDISRDVDYNANLWQLTEEFSERLLSAAA